MVGRYQITPVKCCPRYALLHAADGTGILVFLQQPYCPLVQNNKINKAMSTLEKVFLGKHLGEVWEQSELFQPVLGSPKTKSHSLNPLLLISSSVALK